MKKIAKRTHGICLNAKRSSTSVQVKKISKNNMLNFFER
jgi:hypothetical protein